VACFEAEAAWVKMRELCLWIKSDSISTRQGEQKSPGIFFWEVALSGQFRGVFSV
jgi:hypothetical protein